MRVRSRKPLPPTPCSMCSKVAVRGTRFVVNKKVFCSARCRDEAQKAQEDGFKPPARYNRDDYFWPGTNKPYIMDNDPRLPDEYREKAG